MRRALILALCLLAAGVTSEARADTGAAQEAYERASEAFGRKSYSEAAAGFALADRLQPNPVALEAAFKAVLLADDPVLGMELVERAEQRPPNPKIEGYLKQARAAFGQRAGKLAATCADERGCTVKLNGAVLELGKRHWVRAGSQVLEVTVDGKSTTHQVEIKPGATLEFTAPAPPRPVQVTTPPAPAVAGPAPERQQPKKTETPTSAGLHPAIFGVTAGLFAVAGGVTIWSGVDTLALNDRYLEELDDSAREPGMAAQDRTNVLIGVTIGGAIATTLVAIFTDWGSGDDHAAARPGAAIRYRGRTLVLEF